MHVDTGHNFPEVLAFRDAMVERVGARLVVASVQDDIDAGRGRGGHRPAGQPQPPPDRHAAPRHRGAARSTPCSAAPGATRRRPGPRSGCSASATSSASGTRRTSGPSCGASTTAATARASTSGCSRCPTGPSSTSGSTSPTRTSRLPSIYFAHRRAGVPARRHVARRLRPDPAAATARRSRSALVRFRTVGDITCTGAVESPAATLEAGHRRGRRHPPHRAGRHPRRRPHQRGRHGRPQARGLLLMSTESCCGSPRPGRSTTASRPSSGGCSTTRRRSSRTSSRRWSAPRASGATSTPTSPCSPTACGPSASRASRSTSPTATSPRPSGSSSSPTPPGTSSTRATWSPARRPPTWR